MRYLYLILIVLTVYWISLFGKFVQDDVVVVQNDSRLTRVSSLATMWFDTYYKNDKKAGAYRPVTSVSFVINNLLLGSDSWGYRLINIVLYVSLCLSSLYFFEVFGWDKKLAFVMAIIFGLHPVHTEVVNNIVGRSETLALLGGLWSILLMKRGYFGWSLLVLFLGMMSKESAIVFGFLFLIMIKESCKSTTELFGKAASMVLVVFGYFVLRFVVLGGYMFSNNATMVENPLKYLDTVHRVVGSLRVMGMGFTKILLPVSLSYDYSFNQIVLNDLRIDLWLFVAIFFWLGGVGLLRYWKNEKIRFGVLLSLLPLLVTGNLIFITGTIYGERLALVPSLGVVILFGVLIEKMFDIFKKRKISRNLVYGFVWVVIVCFGIRTFARNIDWLSPKNLFLHDVRVVPNGVLARTNEGAMWLEDRNFEKAKVALDEADKIYKDYPILLNNWGIYYLWQGENKIAEEKFEECLKKYPENELCKYNLSLATNNVR